MVPFCLNPKVFNLCQGLEVDRSRGEGFFEKGMAAPSTRFKTVSGQRACQDDPLSWPYTPLRRGHQLHPHCSHCGTHPPHPPAPSLAAAAVVPSSYPTIVFELQPTLRIGQPQLRECQLPPWGLVAQQLSHGYGICMFALDETVVPRQHSYWLSQF